MEESFFDASYVKAQAMTVERPCNEIDYILEKLPEGASILYMGCGNGRHAIYLAEKGFKVDAFDICENNISKLRRKAKKEDLNINVWVEDVRRFEFKKDYNLIIANGLLEYVDKEKRDIIIKQIKSHTKIGGYNLIVVFTDILELPEEIRPYVIGIFKNGEIKEYYKDWAVKNYQTYKCCDEHNHNNMQTMNKIIVRKPYKIGAIV